MLKSLSLKQNNNSNKVNDMNLQGFLEELGIKIPDGKRTKAKAVRQILTILANSINSGGIGPGGQTNTDPTSLPFVTIGEARVKKATGNTNYNVIQQGDVVLWKEFEVNGEVEVLIGFTLTGLDPENIQHYELLKIINT